MKRSQSAMSPLGSREKFDPCTSHGVNFFCFFDFDFATESLRIDSTQTIEYAASNYCTARGQSVGGEGGWNKL